MTIAYQRIAAVRPANTSEQDLYAVAASTEVIGIIHVCNQDSVTRTFNIAVTDAGTGVGAGGEDWIEYETSIPANVAYKVSIEGLKPTATIRIQASVADKISFVLMGMLKT